MMLYFLYQDSREVLQIQYKKIIFSKYMKLVFHEKCVILHAVHIRYTKLQKYATVISGGTKGWSLKT